jgi:pimeloyl-ACP methyl ester carboxylesterase
MGSAMGDVEVKTADVASGITLPYAEAGTAAGEPVVLVHGYVESWRYFEQVLRLLPDSMHGYAPTQRGYGDADKPAQGYRPEDFAADIVGFMDALAIDRAVLVGSSSGGLLSQIVASTHPARVSALVLISSPAFLGDKPAAAEMWRAVSSFEGAVDRRFVEDFARDTSPKSVADDFVDTLVGESLKAPAHVWRQALRGLIDVDVRASLGKITAPTLLIAGDQDAFAGADQQVLLDAIPDSRLDQYEGAGHGVHLAWPERVVDDITRFLSSIARSG